MELTNEVYKKGTSSIPGYRLDYSVRFVDDVVKTVTAQVKKLLEVDGAKKEQWIGNCMLEMETNRYVISFTNSSAVTAEERAAVFSDFEKTLKALR